MADRLSMANMAIEAGAKNGIFPPDAVTGEYVSPRAGRPYTLYASDPDAVYARTIEIDAGALEPQVAFPHLPSNVRGVSEAGHVKIDQSLIGSCTNGRIEDLRIAAGILKNRKASPSVRLIVVPATPLIYRQAMHEGLLDIFMDANAVISPPSCGACLGGHLGILADGETSIATTNRILWDAWAIPTAKCIWPAPPWPRRPPFWAGLRLLKNYKRKRNTIHDF
jgi:3-isopropylmalate/(R)-2-methylmalate dehydratase large subunit